MSHPTLGQLAPDSPSVVRDALHVAVISLTAGRRLLPGARFKLDAVGCAIPALEDSVGIVDPFLPDVVLKGERFWALLPPGSTTNLSHTWDHHAFPVVAPAAVVAEPKVVEVQVDRPEDPEIVRLREWAKAKGLSIAEVIDEAGQNLNDSCRGCY